MRWARWPGSGYGRRVLEVQPPSDVRVEGDDLPASVAPLDRVAVVAHWAPGHHVGRSVVELVGALLRNQYAVLLVSTADDPQPLVWVGGRPQSVTVLRRPNIGYDFGSWATALDRYPALAASEHVLLLNDSLVGPFASFDHLLRHFEVSAADVWGMTDTSQYVHHLQSYCLGFRRASLCEAPLARFWRDVRVERSRQDVIWRYEVALGRLLERERFVMEAAIPYRRVVGHGQNPTIMGWRALLDQGFPFVKRQLLREPGLAPDGWLLHGELRRRFGIDPEAWV